MEWKRKQETTQSTEPKPAPSLSFSFLPELVSVLPHWGREKTTTLVNYWQTPFKITIYERSEGAAWENLLHSSLWGWAEGSALAVSIHTDLIFSLSRSCWQGWLLPRLCLTSAWQLQPKFSSEGWCHRWMTQKGPWLVLAAVAGGAEGASAIHCHDFSKGLGKCKRFHFSLWKALYKCW